MDVLRKIRLEKQQLIKQAEVEKKHLVAYKTRADQLAWEIEEANKKQAVLAERRDQLAVRLKPVDEQLHAFFAESKRQLELRAQTSQLDSQRLLLERQIKELLALTVNCLFTGSDAELADYIATFKSTTVQMRVQEEQEQLERIDALELKRSSVGESRSRLAAQQGALDARRAAQAHKQRQLAEQAEQCARLLGTSSNKSTPPSELTKTLEERIDDSDREAKRAETRLKALETEWQTSLDSARDQRSKLAQNVSNKSDQLRKSSGQRRQVDDELRQIASGTRVQAELEARIEAMERELADESCHIRPAAEMSERLVALDARKQALKRHERRLNERIAHVHANMKYAMERDMLRRERSGRDEQLRKIRCRIGDDLEAFFGEEPADSDDAELRTLKTRFEAECGKLAGEMSACQQRQREIEKRFCAAEMKRKTDSETLRGKERELRECEDALLNDAELTDDAYMMRDLADVERFDDIMAEVAEKKSALLDEKGYLSGVDKTYKRFLAQIKSKDASSKKKSTSAAQQQQQHHADKSSCPVCMRLFKDEDELNETVAELSKYTIKMPAQVAQLESKLVEIERVLAALTRLSSVKKRYDALRGDETLKLRGQLEDMDKNIKDVITSQTEQTMGERVAQLEESLRDKSVLPRLRVELRECGEGEARLGARKRLADALQNDVVLVDKYASESAELDKKLQMCEANMMAIEEDDDDDGAEDEQDPIAPDSKKVYEHQPFFRFM